MSNWSSAYTVFSGSATTSAVSADVDLQAVYSSHVLEVAVAASGGGNNAVSWLGSLDGVNFYDIIDGNPVGQGGVVTAFYTANTPARHIRAQISTVSGTNTVTITGASKE